MGYSFKDKSEAYELKRIAQQSLGNTGSPILPTGNEVIIVKAPTAGIVAISGTEITSGECTRMFVNEQATQTDITEDTDYTVEVFNTTGEDIVGDSYFQAARCGTAWVSVAGGGGGTSVAMFQSTTAITGNSEGTANVRTFDGTSWTVGTDPFTIVNPWSDSVSTGKILTAYSHSSGKWIMIQAECEDAV